MGDGRPPQSLRPVAGAGLQPPGRHLPRPDSTNASRAWNPTENRSQTGFAGNGRARETLTMNSPRVACEPFLREHTYWFAKMTRVPSQLWRPPESGKAGVGSCIGFYSVPSPGPPSTPRLSGEHGRVLSYSLGHLISLSLHAFAPSHPSLRHRGLQLPSLSSSPLEEFPSCIFFFPSHQLPSSEGSPPPRLPCGFGMTWELPSSPHPDTPRWTGLQVLGLHLTRAGSLLLSFENSNPLPRTAGPASPYLV